MFENVKPSKKKQENVKPSVTHKMKTESRNIGFLTLTSVGLSSITTAAKRGKQVLLQDQRRGGDREDLKSFWKAPIQTPLILKPGQPGPCAETSAVVYNKTLACCTVRK